MLNITNLHTRRFTNSFIYNKELRALLHNLKTKAFELNGIIFGEIVLNSIISKYYKEKFNDKNIDISEFWNIDVDTETIARTVTSNKFDVYFKNFNDYMKFYTYLSNESIYNIVETNNINTSNNFINNKYKINVIIGKTITWSGVTIDLNLNIVTKLPKEKYIEPPFNNSYFTNDLFIMSKDSNGPRFSKNTGIYDLDNMNCVDKNYIYSNIFKDICNFQLSIVSDSILSNNYLASKSLEYLNFGWTIKNLPFTIDKYNNYKTDICYICLDELSNNNVITFKNSCCKLHYDCLLNYINNKLKNNEELVCPLRQKINFYIYTNDLLNILHNNI
jgi:hypothetical protein